MKKLVAGVLAFAAGVGPNLALTSPDAREEREARVIAPDR